MCAVLQQFEISAILSCTCVTGVSYGINKSAVYRTELGT
jgi:hypothetical protein